MDADKCTRKVDEGKMEICIHIYKYIQRMERRHTFGYRPFNVSATKTRTTECFANRSYSTTVAGKGEKNRVMILVARKKDIQRYRDLIRRVDRLLRA